MRLAIRRECSTVDGVPVLRQCPSEGGVVLEVQEVESVANVEQYLPLSFIQHDAAVGHCGACVVVLQLVVVGQWRAVGIQESVGTLVAVHLESSCL